MIYYGWYDPDTNYLGSIALTYWNHVVNTYPSSGKDENDIARYTKEHYVQACKDYMDAHTSINPDRKFIIDLPICEVYFNGTRTVEDGYEENIPIWKTDEWIEYVVNKLNSDERVLGWYHADEPEVWGYREVVNGNVTNSNPPIDYFFLKKRYDTIKKDSKKPVLAVFCDVPLFLDRYYYKILKYGKFFDIFGFDYYPFKLNKSSIDVSRIKNFINISSNINDKLPVLFVGQGSGSPEFNTRVPYIQEHQELFQEFIRQCPEDRRFGYLLWSANTRYANSMAIQNGNIALHYLNDWIKTAIKPAIGRTSIINLILNRLKKLLKI